MYATLMLRSSKQAELRRLAKIILPERKLLTAGLAAMTVSSAVVMAIPAGFGR
jgi:hypothetical protein